MTCPANPPPPAGYRVWRKTVPTPLTQWAMQLRDNVHKYDFGQTWSMQYAGQTVMARLDHHGWTYRNGQLVTGLCIKGITLYEPIPAGVNAALDDVNSDPGPEVGAYGADDVPDQTNWGLVIVGSFAIFTVTWAFVQGMRRAKMLHARR